MWSKKMLLVLVLGVVSVYALTESHIRLVLIYPLCSWLKMFKLDTDMLYAVQTPANDWHALMGKEV